MLRADYLVDLVDDGGRDEAVLDDARVEEGRSAPGQRKRRLTSELRDVRFVV